MNKITSGTIIRTICLLLALANQLLSVAGISPLPIEDEAVSMLVTTLATIGTALVAWWKNNSFTGPAIQGDLVMREIKGGG